MSELNDQPSNLLERVPPHSIAAERCVLGSMLLDGTCIGEVIQLVNRECFVRESHQVLFQALVDLYDKHGGAGIDLVTTKERLAAMQVLDAIGGEAALADIVNAVPAPDHFDLLIGPF